ncbi:MAG TPA: glucosyl hydrolase [Rhodopseudomonas sp.]|uniref:glucosyl hydrolase n=1 Tax=Rhodopseudomonas sp. TaxID=1078 RepID=UPI002ED9B22B
MAWRKLGLVYAPEGDAPWARSHALAPTPVLRDDGRLRIYLSSCDAQMVGSVGYVELDPASPTRVLKVAHRPVLGPGAPGCFDDNGVNVTAMLRVGDEWWMYYFGYQLCQRVRYVLFAGLAISRDDGETFQRVSQVPILDRSDGERYVRSAPFVLRQGDGFRMWYVSGDEFIDVGGKQVPRYGLRYLESDNGLDWAKSGLPIVSPQGVDEYGFGRPFVLATPSGYRMWYSHRTRSQWYRIGYAESQDGVRWTRRDGDAGISTSETGFDSDIVCYASVIDTSAGRLMFYNGNDYGRTGFGVAIEQAGQR